MHTEEEHKEFEEIAAEAALLIYSNRSKSEELIISNLSERIGNNLTARLLYYFLPIAFGWVLLKSMGVEKFPSTFKLLNRNNEEVEFKIFEQSLFMGSLALAFKIFQNGYTTTISKEVVTEIIQRSSEVDAANKALNAGDEIKGASLGPTLIHSIRAEEMLNIGS